MKKQVAILSAFYDYMVTDSEIGNNKIKAHPYQRVLIRAYESHHIQNGDILRCDGLPFQSRPAPLYKQSTNSFERDRVKTHHPVKLPTDLWVLRPVGNIKKILVLTPKGKKK